jgi:hypothetical protein
MYQIAVYCQPKKVYLTDINEQTMENLTYNAHLNMLNVIDDSNDKSTNEENNNNDSKQSEVECTANKVLNNDSNNNSTNECKADENHTNTSNNNETSVSISNLNWKDLSTYPKEKIDIIIGADLVYDENILEIFVYAVNNLLSSGKRSTDIN